MPSWESWSALATKSAQRSLRGRKEARGSVASVLDQVLNAAGGVMVNLGGHPPRFNLESGDAQAAVSPSSAEFALPFCSSAEFALPFCSSGRRAEGGDDTAGHSQYFCVVTQVQLAAQAAAQAAAAAASQVGAHQTAAAANAVFNCRFSKIQLRHQPVARVVLWGWTSGSSRFWPPLDRAWQKQTA